MLPTQLLTPFEVSLFNLFNCFVIAAGTIDTTSELTQYCVVVSCV